MNNKTKKPNNSSISPTIHTRDVATGIAGKENVYKGIAIMAKRANQIAVKEREELHAKLKEFESTTDNLEEVFENREQIEISRYYEKQPKPSLVALHEWMENNIYHRLPEKDKNAKE